MTEARTPSLTPFLLYLPPQSDAQLIVTEWMKKIFPSSESDEVVWINNEQQSISIEMVRDIHQTLSFAPYTATLRHVVLLDIHTASVAAQNALLKVLEEPPQRTQFWLTASTSGSVLPTISSRCQEVLVPRRGEHNISRETIELVRDIPKLSHRELVDAAEKYSDRDKASTMVMELIFLGHQHIKDNPQQFAELTRVALQTQQYLEANVNTKLAVENLLFDAKKILSS